MTLASVLFLVVVCQPLLSSSPKTHRRRKWGGCEDDTQRKRKERKKAWTLQSGYAASRMLGCPFTSVIKQPRKLSVCSSRGAEPAGRELWVWQRWLPLFRLHEMSSLLYAPRGSLRADTQTDRQTDKPQAAQRSEVEIAVTSHRKLLLTGMLHRSDTTKQALTDPNIQGEKCPEARNRIRVEIECVDCTCQLCRIHVLKAAWKEIKMKKTVLINKWPQTVYSYSVRSGWPWQLVLYANWQKLSVPLHQCHQDDAVYIYCSWQFKWFWQRPTRSRII